MEQCVQFWQMHVTGPMAHDVMGCQVRGNPHPQVESA
jgi:hypothetical protein